MDANNAQAKPHRKLLCPVFSDCMANPIDSKFGPDSVPLPRARCPTLLGRPVGQIHAESGRALQVNLPSPDRFRDSPALASNGHYRERRNGTNMVRWRS